MRTSVLVKSGSGTPLVPTGGMGNRERKNPSVRSRHTPNTGQPASGVGTY